MLLLVDYWLVVGWNLSILWTFGNQDSSNWFICGAHRVQLASLANRRVNHVRGWCCSSCLRFFLGCLPLWWLLDPAEGDCCGLLLDPLCHLALLLSVASLTHVLFQYCAISSLGGDFPILFLCSWVHFGWFRGNILSICLTPLSLLSLFRWRLLVAVHLVANHLSDHCCHVFNKPVVLAALYHVLRGLGRCSGTLPVLFTEDYN